MAIIQAKSQMHRLIIEVTRPAMANPRPLLSCFTFLNEQMLKISATIGRMQYKNPSQKLSIPSTIPTIARMLTGLFSLCSACG